MKRFTVVFGLMILAACGSSKSVSTPDPTDNPNVVVAPPATSLDGNFTATLSTTSQGCYNETAQWHIEVIDPNAPNEYALHIETSNGVVYDVAVTADQGKLSFRQSFAEERAGEGTVRYYRDYDGPALVDGVVVGGGAHQAPAAAPAGGSSLGNVPECLWTMTFARTE